MLALLDKTDMQLLSPIEMIRQYKHVPLCGEIIQGGLNTAQTEAMPSFSLLSSEKFYPLEFIIQHYTQFNDSPIAINVTQLYQRAFCEINIILLYFTKAKQ